jgi:DNA-binding transcriptional ArsR family regulator
MSSLLAKVPKDLDATLLALADPARRAVIELLRQKPWTSSDLANELELSRPAMSRHLKLLRQAGLVEDQIQLDDARVRLYQLRQAPFAQLRTWIEEVEAFWDDQLQAFKQHAEAKYGGL